jgi:sugar/nucleoside kinase (ribokinase family)
MLVTCAGILVVDLIAAHLPKVSDPGELTYAPKGIEVHMGGHSGNVSINLTKLGLEKGEVSSVGAVGEDIFGDFLERLLEENGIVTHLQRLSRVGTSKDLILVVSGEDRRFHCDIGANWHLSPEHVLSILVEEKPLIFYAGGVGFTGRFDEELAKVLRRAKELGCLTFVDPVTPYKQGWDFIIPPIEWTDIFHCNKDEAEKITGKGDPIEAARVLTGKGAQLAIISLGQKGLIAETEDVLFEMPAFKVPVVDPTGAGDALCAGVMRGLLRVTGYKRREVSELSKDELARILLEGEAAGASCVTMIGTTTAVTEENVSKLLEEKGETVLKSHLKVSHL